MQNRVLSKILQKHELRQCNVLDNIASEKFTKFWFSNQNVVWRKYTFYLIFFVLWFEYCTLCRYRCLLATVKNYSVLQIAGFRHKSSITKPQCKAFRTGYLQQNVTIQLYCTLLRYHLGKSHCLQDNEAHSSCLNVKKQVALITIFILNSLKHNLLTQ